MVLLDYQEGKATEVFPDDQAQTESQDFPELRSEIYLNTARDFLKF